MNKENAVKVFLDKYNKCPGSDGDRTNSYKELDMIYAFDTGAAWQKQKDISAYIESCEYKSNNDCWRQDVHGNIPTHPKICTHENCEFVKVFINKLDNDENKRWIEKMREAYER